jgi:hypothetical protein
VKIKHEIAWWASVAAFFGSLATIGAIDIVNPNNTLKLLGSIIIAIITGGGVYSKQRLDEAKSKKGDPEQ